MADVHLFDNFIGPPGITPVTGDWHAYGVAFYCNQNFQVDALRYWAPTSTITDHPVRLHFWDGETGAELGQRTVPDHDGLVGWKDVAFGTPLTCEAYHRYVISGDNGGSRHVAYVGVAPGTPDRLFWDSNPTVQSVTDGHDLYPNTTYTNWALLDAALSPSGTPAPSPDYDTGIENAFVRWESSGGDNTRPLGLPKLTYDAVTGVASNAATAASNSGAIKTVTDRLNNLSNGAITWLNDRSAQLTDLLNTVSADAVTALNNLSTRITGNDGTGGSAFRGPSGAPMATTIEDVNAKLDTLAAAVAACCDWLDGRVLNELKLSTPVTYTINGYGYLETLRNVHRISVGTVPAEVSSLDVGGHLWLPRFGWWAPVTSQGAVLERHYIDWHDQWLWPAPAGTIGIAFHLPLGVDATVYAYTPLTEP